MYEQMGSIYSVHRERTANNLKGWGIHNCAMNIFKEEKWAKGRERLKEIRNPLFFLPCFSSVPPLPLVSAVCVNIAGLLSHH